MIDFDWDGDYVIARDGKGVIGVPLRDIREYIEFEYATQRFGPPDPNDPRLVGDLWGSHAGDLWLRGRCLRCDWISTPLWAPADNGLFALGSLGVIHRFCVEHLAQGHSFTP